MFSVKIRNQIIECVKVTHDDNSIQLFSVSISDKIKITYDQSTAVGLPFDVRVPKFIDELILQGTIIVFLNEYCPKYIQHAFVAELAQTISSIYDTSSPTMKRKKTSYELVFLKSKLPFLNRQTFKETLFRVVEGNRQGVILLKGQPQSGLSYLGWYLSELSHSLGCFEFYSINLKEVFKKEMKSIDAIQLGLLVADKIGMEFKPEGLEPKITPFFTSLRMKVASMKDKVFLIFIDQFDVPLSAAAEEFIDALAKTVVYENASFFLVLSGYRGYDDWPFEVLSISEEVDISNGSFNRSHVDSFFACLYDQLVYAQRIEAGREQFLQLTREFIPDDLLNVPSEGSNVTQIGRRVFEFCKRMQQV
jgi:hypothetical protein